MNDLATELSKQLKSAPVESLTHRLALSLCQANHSFGGLLGVAHLWQEFILEIRFRWENKHLLCDIEKGAPNMGSSLLHQKLQMLNSCIECKIKRESVGYGYGPDSSNSNDHSFDSDDKDDREAIARMSKQGSFSMSSDDEEFFDADDDEGHFTKPVGRLVPMKNMTLLDTGSQLYIPITQEPSPMTEDMLEEQAEVLAKLGTSAEGSMIRARMQSACLVSDMESFKAANPGCIIEDFVRWYSPRDYVIEDDEDELEKDKPIDSEEANSTSSTTGAASDVEKPKKPAKRGYLSQRMLIPGNMWVEAWQSARPVPARRQKRLFDDTKEAEKVLHYLASMKPSEVVLHLMPCIIHAAIIKLAEEAIDACVPNYKSIIDTLISRAATVTRNFPLDKKKYSDLLRLIELAETVTARTTSLRSKFKSDHLACPEQEGKEEEIESFVTQILTNSQCEVPVRGGACGPAGAIIHKMFITAQKANNMILDDEEDIDCEGISQENPGATLERNENRRTSLPSPSLESKLSQISDFPPPCAREYILRAMVPRPAPYSKVLPQRMYCLLREGENRLAGAFTSDTTFQ